MSYFYCYVTVAYVCIPRSFVVINVCNQGKSLCSPCRSEIPGKFCNVVLERDGEVQLDR
jgi:hypothetical protein